MPSLRLPACVVAGALLVAACGGSSSSQISSSSSAASAPSGSSAASTQGAGALSADATSARTGDIPDNQVFLLYSDHTGGFAMKYPEGWTQSGSGHQVSFRDKNNVVRIVIGSGAAPTPVSVTAQLAALRQSNPGLQFRAAAPVKLSSGAAVKAVYTIDSAPNPVTGRRVHLTVDRYEFAHGGHVATVDLGTPQGVDNIDAYRMMINSFRWL